MNIYEVFDLKVTPQDMTDMESVAAFCENKNNCVTCPFRHKDNCDCFTIHVLDKWGGRYKHINFSPLTSKQAMAADKHIRYRLKKYAECA